MRLGIISDIHGNLVALESVLAELDQMSVERLICLGDVVGYGPDAGECLDLLQACDAITIAGNHEEALCRPEVARRFNGIARVSIEYARRQFITERPDLLHVVAELPGMAYLCEKIMCVHDSPIPGGSGYIQDGHVAADAFAGVDTAICLIGHTHVPVAFRGPAYQGMVPNPSQVETFRPEHTCEIHLDTDARWIINPGSVGQPRDGDVRAACGILDLDAMRFQWVRVAYDVARAQERTEAAGLPSETSRRLSIGA